MAQPQTKNAVLSLREKEPDRPFLSLGGTRYHFKLKADLSIQESLEVARVGKRFQGFDLVEADEASGTQFAEDVCSSVRIVMYDMPKDVQASLTDGERMAIIEAFGRALTTKTRPSAQSAKASPDSPTATKQTPKE